MLFNPVVGGGIKLPSLTNPAAAADIMQNKQAIDQNGQIITGTKAPLPTLTNPGTAGDLLSGKQLIGSAGNIITGTIATKGSGNLSVNGATVTVPAGYYPSQVSKSVATATQATPTISVSSSGLITASSTQSAGYVSSGTKKETKQLTTQAGKTITPGTSQQTAVASGRYTTGTVYVAGDSDLKAANIKKGINIFGVTGSFEGDSSYKLWTQTGWNPDNWTIRGTRYGELEITIDDISINKIYAGCFWLDWYIDGELWRDCVLTFADDYAAICTTGSMMIYGEVTIVNSNTIIYTESQDPPDYRDSENSGEKYQTNFLVYS